MTPPMINPLTTSFFIFASLESKVHACRRAASIIEAAYAPDALRPQPQTARGTVRHGAAGSNQTATWRNFDAFMRFLSALYRHAGNANLSVAQQKRSDHGSIAASNLGDGGDWAMSEQGLRPTVFVVMPYGVKPDPATLLDIDFDDVWLSAFRPAAERAGVEAIRADEERLGGFVHLAMFERLLLAEIVLADLTLASPNVMYELGIRHTTRPRATISVFARIGQLPFDLSSIRAIPYQLDAAGQLTDEAKSSLVDELAQRLSGALTDTAADSPLFQLIQSYPGVTLPHEVTESFQHRVQTISTLSMAIRSAPSRLPRAEALKELTGLAKGLSPTLGTPTDLFLDLLLSYRDIEAFEEVVELADSLPTAIRDHPTVQQMIAFALNRRGATGDQTRAINILTRLIDEQGAHPETLGLLGRVHKDRYGQLRNSDPFQAEAALAAAIDAYERGFRVDMRDYYPGVNAVTLLMLEGSDESYRRARELSPVVAFAVATRQGIDSKDYWDVATVLELAVVNLDEATAWAAARRLVYIDGPDWRRRTTAENLQRLHEAHPRRVGPQPWLDEIMQRVWPAKPA
jgi:MAP3K TRAFs-binding domain